MRLRSLLFVPGDRPDRMVKALTSGADALIFDLEDAVALGKKSEARRAIAAALGQDRSGVKLFVRINPLPSGLAADDLDAVLPAAPDGIMLPKAEGAASLIALDQMLSERGDTNAMILPIATETPIAMFRLDEYGGITSRLVAMTWGAEDLPASVGATSAREADGSYTAPIEVARALTLFGAAAAGVQPIETVYPRFSDMEGLAAYAARGARDGFTGMMAIHPAQVAVINDAFTPSEEAVIKARIIVDAFAAAPDAGVLSIDGQMIDAPHLKQAQRILARATG